MLHRVAVAVLSGLAAAVLVAGPAQADRPFTQRFSTNDTGAVALAGAPLMSCNPTPPAKNAAVCGRVRAGLQAPPDNNDFGMVPVNTEGTALNSSTAQLSLPPDAQVLFAGLYWGADDSKGDNGAAPAGGVADQALFRAPGGAFTRVTADQFDRGTGGSGNSNAVNRYQSFEDVTAQVAEAGSGTYAVGGVRLGTGGDRYAGWSLVVAYRDPTLPARNLTIFDGLTTILANAAPRSLTVSGFRTPPTGPVRTTVGFVTYEGDRGLVGDGASLNGTTLSDAANPATNAFNSSSSRRGALYTDRDPNYPNQLGYDSDLLNADGILPNGATDATIRLSTSGDQYLPGVITFATDLFAPDLTLVKSVANRTHPAPGAATERGDVLRYTVTARNTGDDGADDVVLRDLVPAGTTYVPGSVTIGGEAVTDAAGDDRGEVEASGPQVVARVGTGASATRGGRLAKNATATISFDARVGDVLPRTLITNGATSTFVGQSLRTPLTAISNDVTTTVAAPDLTLTKVHDPDFVAGSPSTFRLVVSNVGNLPTDGTPIVVTDDLPAGAFSAIGTPIGTGWTCTVDALRVRCTRADVRDAGSSLPPITIPVTVADPAPSAITNTAVVAGGGNADLSNDTATDVGGTATAADLQVTKTTSTPTVISGDTATWTITVRNAGPSTATDVVVDDPRPSGLAAVTATPSQGSCTAVVRCTLGTLTPGAIATVTVSARVTANDTTLTNTASAKATPQPDPDPSNDQASSSVTVLNTADLRVAKTASDPDPSAGGAETYTVTVTNDGPGTATGVELVDDLPAGFVAGTPTVSAGTCDAIADRRVRCVVGTLASGQSATLTMPGTFDPGTPAGTVSNTARAQSPTQDPDLTNNSDTAVVQVGQSADLSITKEWGTLADPFQVSSDAAPGATVRVRLTAQNLGPSTATAVVVADTLPAGSTYLSAAGAPCAAAGQVVTCQVGTLAPGARTSVLLTVRVERAAAGTVLRNEATIAGNPAVRDPNASNDTSSDSLAVGPAADLGLGKTGVLSQTATGFAITYTLTVTNAGPNTATAVSASDVLPAGLTWVPGSGCAATGGTVTCSFGSIGPNVTVSRSFTVNVAGTLAGTLVTNQATVASPVPDPEAGDNTATAETPIPPLADLALTKTASDPTPAVDQDVTYTLTATNAGPSPATGVEITDTLPTGMQLIAAPGCTATATTVSCPVGDVAVGASATATITLRAGPELAGATLTNSATVRAAERDLDLADNDARADVRIGELVDLRVTKQASAPSVAVGVPVTYTILVTNAGPSASTGTTVVDTLPAGLTATAAQPSQGSCTVAAAEVSCGLGTVAAGGSAQVLVTAVAAAGTAGTTLRNVAVATSDQPPLGGGPSSGTSDVAITPPVGGSAESGSPAPAPPTGSAESQQGVPVLAVTKTVDRATATTADRLRYRITVRNTGDTAATSVVLTDTFTRAVRVLAASTTAGSCGRAAPIRCVLGTLAPGATVTITVDARATGAGTLANTAAAVAANAAAAQARASVRVTLARAALALTKTASRGRVSPGQTLRYTLRLRVPGSRPAVGVRLCDRLPDGLTVVRAPGARFSGGSACWSLGTLAGGTTRTLTLTVRAERGGRARSIRNTAVATATNTARVTGQATVRLGADTRPGRPGGVTG